MQVQSLWVGAAFGAALVASSGAQANTLFDLDISPSGTNGPAIFYLGTGPIYPITVGLEIAFSNPGGSPLAYTLPPNSSAGGCSASLFAGTSCQQIIDDIGPYLYGTAQVETETFTFTDAAGAPITDNVTIELEPELAPTPLPATLSLFATGLGALGLFGWRRKRNNTAALAA